MQDQKLKNIFDSVHNGNLNEVKSYFGKKKSFCVTNSLGQTPLHVACSDGHLHLTQYFIRDKKRCDINSKDNEGRTPLHCACFYGHIDIVDYLIINNADLSKTTLKGSVPLHYFVKMNIQTVKPALFERIFRTMIRKGVNINIQNNRKTTPLHKASFLGKQLSVSLLLNHKANPNLVNHTKESPLHLATRGKHINIVKNLLDSKADCNIIGSFGSVFDVARSSNNQEIINLFQRLYGTKLCPSNPVNEQIIVQPHQPTIISQPINYHLTQSAPAIVNQSVPNIVNKPNPVILNQSNPNVNNTPKTSHPVPCSVCWCTCPDKPTAEKISQLLLQYKVCACVNIIPGITSMYWWENKIEKSQEYLLMIKTTTENQNFVINAIKQYHPYDVPEVICADITNGNMDYLSWVTESCKRN